MSELLPLPFALPLGAAALGFLFQSRRAVQRVVSLVLLATLVGFGVVLVGATADTTLATTIGTWPPLLSIVFAADRFAALLVTVASSMALLATVFAIARGEDDHPLFHPAVAVLIAGVCAAFLTADLFNLFVAFEVMLIASYLLLTLRGGREQVRAGAVYVTVNLLASTLFLIGVGLTYATSGTVNLGALASAIEAEPAGAVGISLVLVAAGVKASLVPVHSWLPRSYVHTGPAVTALFSGLLTKAGIAVLFRLWSVVLGGPDAARPWLLAIAMVTMVVGVLGAVGRGDIRGILSFHMVSQVGYLVLPLGIWTVAGTTAGIVYLIQYVFIKGALFIAAGAVETLTGTGRLAELGGMLRTRPVLAVAFLLPALSLAGIPPTTGFVGKFLLVLAAFDSGALLAGAVAVVVSLFTLLSMTKIWNGVFWSGVSERVRTEPGAGKLGRAVPAGAAGAGEDEETPPPRPPTAVPAVRLAGLIGPAMLVAAATVLLGVGGEWLIELAAPAAEALHDPTGYIEAVTAS